MQKPLISLHNVSKVFDNTIILDNINFEIKYGVLTTLIGPNGAGKSTLAKIILELEKPSSGYVIKKEGLNIGYVPQQFIPPVTLPITTQYFLKLLINKIPNDYFSQTLLEFAQYDQLKEQNISSLSGGQIQKLLLIANCLRNIDLLILDEPTQSLDISSQHEFYAMLNSLLTVKKITIFMISHDLHMVMKNSQHVICVNKHVCCSGSPCNINENKQLTKALADIGFYQHTHDHKH